MPGVRFARAPVAQALSLAMLLALGAQQAAQAQPQNSGAPAAISIAAQPLSQALTELARQTGTTLVAAPALLAGKQAPAVAGNLAPQQALNRLLAGSGLDGFLRDGVITVQRAAQNGEVSMLPAVTVTARPERSGALPEAYAGGLVARGGRLGVLGNTDLMDAPFNVTSYTSELIENQQARTLADVVQNDASVRSVFAEGAGIGQIYIRGFLSANQDTAFNGQFGIAPAASGVLAMEMYERVEVLKGASSFLYGIPPSGSVGGVINVVSKRAGAEPVTRLTFSGGSKDLAGLHADIGRRFGPDQALGIRVNALRRSGEAAWEANQRETTLGSIAFDMNTRRIRASLDLGYQEQRSEVMPVSIRLGAGVAVPRPPEPGRSYSQRYVFNDSRNRFAALRGEFDITDTVQAYATYGWNELLNEVLSSFPTVTNAATGAMTEGGSARFHSNTRTERSSAEAGVRARFASGQVGHTVALSVNEYREQSGVARETFGNIASNLYAPIPAPRPTLQDFPGRPNKTSESRFSSVAAADTLDMFNDRMKLTLGLRSQKVENSAFNGTTGAQTAHYDKSAVTPFAAVVFKATNNVSLYANRIEALSQGSEAPPGTSNAGTVLPPIRSKQYEAGAKVDFGPYAVTASLFQIERPAASTDLRTNSYGLTGEQRNRGVEFGVFGEPVRGIRALGGATYTQGRLTRTANGANEGNTAPGVPKLQVNLGGEYDVAALPGLTLNARAIYTSSQYYDAENVRSIPGWTRFDIGARYTIKSAYPVTLRATVENVANRRYWASSVGTFGSELNAGAPRTFLLSASVAF